MKSTIVFFTAFAVIFQVTFCKATRFEDLPSVKSLIQSVLGDNDQKFMTIEELWENQKTKFSQMEIEEDTGISVNERPMIGILSQPTSSHPPYTTYIQSAYVKFIEEGGARVVPIVFDEPDEVTLNKLDKLNGVLLPGGDEVLQNDDGSLTPYSLKGKLILDYVKEQNEKSIYYPLYAVCQGFEQISVIEAPFSTTLVSAAADNTPLNIDFYENPRKTRLYKNMPDKLIAAMETQTITMFNNIYRVQVQTYLENENLKNYNVIATAKDREGKVMVASIEHEKYPIYAHQFHPEKNQFVWKADLPIPHSKNAIDMTRYFAEFVVSESRKNFNKFDTYQEELENMIENSPVIVTKGTLQDEYVF